MRSVVQLYPGPPEAQPESPRLIRATLTPISRIIEGDTQFRGLGKSTKSLRDIGNLPIDTAVKGKVKLMRTARNTLFLIFSACLFCAPASAVEDEIPQLGGFVFRIGATHADATPMADALNDALGTTEFSSAARTDVSGGFGFRFYPFALSLDAEKPKAGFGLELTRLSFGFNMDYVPQITTPEFLDPVLGPSRLRTRLLPVLAPTVDYALIEAGPFRLRGHFGAAFIRHSMVLQGINPFTGQWQSLAFGGASFWNILGQGGVTPEFRLGSRGQYSLVPVSYTRMAGGITQMTFQFGMNF